MPSETAESIESLLTESGFFEWQSMEDIRLTDGLAWEVIASTEAGMHCVVVQAQTFRQHPGLHAPSDAQDPEQRREIDDTYPLAHQLARDFFDLVDEVRSLAQRDGELLSVQEDDD